MTMKGVTKEDIFLSILQNEGKANPKGVVKALTIRIPVHQYAAVEAYHRHTGLSRNRIISEVLEFALDVAFRGLDRNNKKAYTQLESAVVAELLENGLGEYEENL